MRLENGAGSVIKLSGNRRKPYAARITVGWKDGKQQRKYLGYYKSPSEAMLALAEYHEKGFDLDLSKATLGEVYDRWIKRIEPKSSRNVLNSHNMARMRFGNMASIQISRLKADHLQDWMDGIEDLSAGSKKRMKSTMIQIWKYAMKNDIVNENYAEYIEINEKTEKKGKIFTDEEIQKLWDNVDNPTVQWILILVYTGMRIGELLLITADNIYLDKGYIIGGFKSEAGTDRIIPLHNKILPLVEQRLGKAKQLMRDEHGRKLSYAKALRQFDDLMLEWKLEHKPHDTRKTGVSLMHRFGIPMETIRVIVGHSGKGVTEKVYLYKEPEELVAAINKIEL